MDFFTRQDHARRNTKWLVAWFILAVVLIIAAVYLVVAVTFLRSHYEPGTVGWLWNTKLFWGVAGSTFAIIFGGTLYKMADLREGGGAVASMLGGKLIDPKTADEDQRKLLNVVEEMSIASGTPVPEIYVLHRENAINAFAAGHTTNDAAIGVTRGCMRLLNRDELQGVIAHEFSHILNGDMRLNLRLIGIIHGILGLAILGRILLRTGSSDSSSRKGGNPLPLVGLALLAIGSIGVFFGRLIKSAVSRQREFLADAAAVQFTRNPSGLAGALKKIGGYAAGSRLLTARAEEASHLYFGNGLGEAWFNLMATHPPLDQRIRAIDPAFDGKYPAVLSIEAQERQNAGIPYEPAGKAAKPSALIPALMDWDRESADIAAGEFVARVGTTSPKHLEYAVNFRASLPEKTLHTLHDPIGAAATVFALVLSSDPKVQQEQRQIIQREFGDAVEAQTLEMRGFLAAQDATARLPLLMLTLSALRQLPPADYNRFDTSVTALVEADCEIDVFEFTVQKALRRHLAPQFKPAGRSVPQYYSMRPLLPDCAVLLSALAYTGHANRSDAFRALTAGLPQLRAGVTGISLLEPEQCGLGPVDQALDRLALAVPQIKKNLLDACAHTVAADATIKPAEAELLRAIADALDCPIPPFLKGL